MLSVVIQAGGESRRMGKDKALVPFLGIPLVERVLERVVDLGDEVILTTNKLEEYRYLNLPLYQDKLPDRGALGGLYTALSVARSPLVAVVACDMPFVSANLLAAERDLLVSTGSDAVIPQTEGGTEPFHAVYYRQPCLPAIEAALHGGKWRVDSWFGDVKLRFMSPEEMLPHDPDQIAFWNVNTLEELHRAEQMASRRES